MHTIVFNDKLGHRSLKHLNLLFGTHQEHQVILEFKGVNIEGVCHIISGDYTKNGKWSHSTWELAIPDSVEGFELHQDWDMGCYFPQKTWVGVHQNIVKAMQKSNLCTTNLDMDCVKRFVNTQWPDFAKELDVSDANLNMLQAKLNEGFAEIYEAQRELREAQNQHEEVRSAIEQLVVIENTRKQAEILRAKTREIKAAMAKGASLADLQAMFDQA